LWVVCAIVAMVAGSLGCGSKSSAPTSASTTNDVAPFAGTWTANVLPSGVTELPGCTDFTYTVTPTGLTTASIGYTANCSGLAVSGSGSGITSGSTLNWTTMATA